MRKFEKHLETDELRLIENSFIELVEYDKQTRERILSDLDSRYVKSHLKKIGDDPLTQLKNDLIILNKTLRLKDDTIPMCKWLKGAANEFNTLEEKQIFTDLLKKVKSDINISVEREILSPVHPIKQRNNINVRTIIILTSIIITAVCLKLLNDQGVLFSSTNFQDKEVSVVVLDISGIEKSENGVTPADKLLDIVKELVGSGAKAIAIDIDFSPRIDDYSNEPRARGESDEEFFQSLLDIREINKIPIYLGSFNVGVESSTWLGLDDYKELAADMGLLKDTTEVPAWLKCEGSTNLNSISRALANSSNRKPQLSNWLQNFLVAYDDKQNIIEIEKTNLEEKKVSCQKSSFLVNYAQLKQIKQSKIQAQNKEGVWNAKNNFRDKLVIIGYAQRDWATDPFIVAEHKEPVFGIFIHASATHTLIAAPFYKLKLWIRILLDLLLIVTLLIGLYLIHILTAKKNNHSLNFIEDFFIAVFVVLTFGAGLALTKYYNILWSDFYAVCLAIFFHSQVRSFLISTVSNVLNTNFRNSSKEE